MTYLRPKNKISSDADACRRGGVGHATGNSKKKTPPKTAATDKPGEAGHRKYLGYIVRIYYSEQLQAVRADPTKLLNLFPPPLTAPQ